METKHLRSLPGCSTGLLLSGLTSLITWTAGPGNSYRGTVRTLGAEGDQPGQMDLCLQTLSRAGQWQGRESRPLPLCPIVRQRLARTVSNHTHALTGGCAEHQAPPQRESFGKRNSTPFGAQIHCQPCLWPPAPATHPLAPSPPWPRSVGVTPLGLGESLGADAVRGRRPSCGRSQRAAAQTRATVPSGRPVPTC